MVKREWLWILVLAMGLFIARVPFMDVPLERDEGEYAYCAWQMQQGVMPYRDIITHVSPGIFFIYRTAFIMFDHTIRAIRLFTTLYLLLALVLFYYLARQLLGCKGALLAGGIFIFLTTDPGLLANMSQREIFTLVPLMLSFLLLQKDLTGHRWYYAAGNGLVIAIAFMIKPTTIFQLLFVCGIWSWDYILRKDHKVFWLRIFWLTAGLVGGVCPLIYYFSRHHALPEFLYWNFVFPKLFSKSIAAFYPTVSHLSASLLYKLKHNFKGIFISQFPLGILLLLSLILTLYQRKRELALYWLWFLVLLLSTAVGWHFREQYFQLIIVPQALLVTWGIQRIYRALATKGRLVITGYCVLAGVLVSYPFAQLLKQYYFIGPNMILRKLYGRQIFPIAQPIGKYVAEQTIPTDKIYILGSEQEIYFYSQRACANAYIAAYLLTYAYGDPITRQKEVISSLRASLPVFIIKINQVNSIFDMPAVNKVNIIFDEVYKLVKEKYVLDGFGYIDLQKEVLVLGRGPVEASLPGCKTVDEQLDSLYKTFGGFNPDVLIFRRKN